MPSESPFLTYKIECPVCQTINEFEQVKVGAYNEGGRDTDFCPQDIQWRHPKYQAHNPLLYFTASCSNCYYTRELTAKYREWKADNSFRTFQLKNLKAKHLERLSVADSVVRQLGEMIDQNRYPNESGIIKLHLAIFDALLTDHPSKLDLGRFYLRIGWIFRGLSDAEDPNKALLRSLIRDIDGKLTTLHDKISESQSALDELNEAVRSHFDTEQFPADLQSQMFAFRDRYDVELDRMNGSLDSTSDRHIALRMLVEEYRAEILGGSTAEGPASFGEHQTFKDYLMMLQRQWNGVVASEQEALEQAIRYYKEAFATGRDIAAGNQQVQASYLIAELSRRIGDYDGAKQFFTSTIKAGQEFIYANRRDQARTALTRKILELAIEQGRANLAASQKA
jgi:uncharacterized protein (DUF2225 family)